MVSVEYLLKQKRINFLHHILTSEDQSLAKKIFLKQVEKPLKDDFVKIVNKDLMECKIKLTYEEIQNISNKKFKELVKEAITKASFEKLLSEKEKLSKGKEIQYKQLKTQPYLLPGNNLNIDEMRKILQVRIRDAPVKDNFKNAYKSFVCSSPGCSSVETQVHLFNSSCWDKHQQVPSVGESKYENIFQNDVIKQMEVMCRIFEKIHTRDIYLRNDGPLEPGEKGTLKERRVPNLVIRKAKKKCKHTSKRPKVNRSN